jgi:hypothetical protein
LGHIIKWSNDLIGHKNYLYNYVNKTAVMQLLQCNNINNLSRSSRKLYNNLKECVDFKLSLGAIDRKS